jgi:hypothetical protein
MFMNIYKPVGRPEDADCVVGHSFSTSLAEGSVNIELANQMLHHSDGRPMIADRMLVNAMPDGDSRMAHVVEGPVTNLNARGVKGVGTWGTLVEALEFMDENGLEAPIMIAQAFHMRRVVKQAAKLGIDSIIPKGLPADFDHDSEQLWTKSLYFWIPMNGLGSLLLRNRGQL